MECAVHDAGQTGFHLREHRAFLFGSVVPPRGDFVQGTEAAVAELGLRVDDADPHAGGRRVTGWGRGIESHDEVASRSGRSIDP